MLKINFVVIYIIFLYLHENKSSKVNFRKFDLYSKKNDESSVTSTSQKTKSKSVKKIDIELVSKKT